MKFLPFAPRSFWLLILGGTLLRADAQTNGHWDGRFWIAGFSAPRSLATDAGGNLLMTGTPLRLFDGVTMPALAAWDGRRWTPLTNSRPAAILAAGHNTWLAGTPRSNLVTQLPAAGEAQLLPPVSGRIGTLAHEPAGLLAGGKFVAGDSGTATNVARWDGAGWQSLGGGVPRPVARLLAADGQVFAGISAAGGEPATVWQWDGAVWAALAPLPGAGEPQVADLLWHEGRLLAASTTAGVATNLAVQAWAGGAWQAVGAPGLHGSARALAVFLGQLYVAGSVGFDGGPDLPAGFVRLAGDRWEALESGPGELLSEGSALAVAADQLFVLAHIPRSLGLTGASVLGLWQHDGQASWLHGCGLEYVPSVRGLAESPAGLVLAAAGTGPGGAGRHGYLWDGRLPRQLGTAAPAPGVTIAPRGALAAVAGQVYQAATRTPAAPEGGSLVARLEGTNWVAATAATPYTLGSLVAIAEAGENLYATGSGAAAGSGTNVVIRWHAGRWNQVGAGFTGGPLVALATVKETLFAGGWFQAVGGQPAARLAVWNGAEWLGVSPAPDAAVQALTAWGNGLVVAGQFTNVGGLRSPGVALWTPQGWQPLADGLELAEVTAVAVSRNGTLAVAGPRAGRTEFRLRRDAVWQRIGIGSSGGSTAVGGLLWRGRDLFAGGSFIDIDGIQSDTFAIWHEPGTELELRRGPGRELLLRRTGVLPGTSVLERGAGLPAFAPWRINSPFNLRDVFPAGPADGDGFFRERDYD